MKKKGAVPVPYIIALLLGIAVVAILGYWFFVLGGEWGGEVTIQRCRTRAHTLCSSWMTAGWSTVDVDGVDTPSVGWFVDKYPDCATFAPELGFSSGTSASTDQAACEEILGQ